jgi:ABC-type branched-subunit amino acid transport system substrate-binding protein
MKAMRILSLLVVMSLFSGVLAGCGPAGPTKVKMGALLPLTGALSEFGGSFRNAGDLAVKHLEEAGVSLELVYGDTETSAMPGVDAARNLVDVEKAVALIGAASSGVTMPIAQSVSIPSEVPQISNASTNPLMTNLPADEGKDFLFRTCPSDARQGVVLGNMAADEGYGTVSVLYVNNPYGEGLAEVFTETFEGRGGTVPAMVPHDEEPAPTYVAELEKVLADEPDAMVALAYPGQATVYLKEFFEAGYDAATDLLFVDGTKSADMPVEIGVDLMAGYFGTAPGSKGGEPLEKFTEAFEAEYGELKPLPFTTNFYDAVVVAALAAAKCDADGVDVTPINVRDRLRDVANPPGEVVMPGAEGIKKAVELIKDGKDVNYEGAAGAVDFDENGDVVTPIEVWKYIAEDPYIESVRMEEVK